jgi:hypothetical protein
MVNQAAGYSPLQVACRNKSKSYGRSRVHLIIAKLSYVTRYLQLSIPNLDFPSLNVQITSRITVSRYVLGTINGEMEG